MKQLILQNPISRAYSPAYRLRGKSYRSIMSGYGMPSSTHGGGFKKRRIKRKRRSISKTSMKTRRTRKYKAVSRRKRGKRTTITISKRRRLSKSVRRVAKNYRLKRPFTLRANPVNVKSVFNKENLLVVGGLISGQFVTNQILARFGSNLPYVANVYGRAAYSVAIPVAVAALVSKVSRPVASGMVLAGLANGVSILLANFTGGLSAPVAATAEYLDAPRPMAAYLDANTGGALASRGVKPFAGAFPTTAW